MRHFKYPRLSYFFISGALSTVQVFPQPLLPSNGLQSVHSRCTNWSANYVLGTLGLFLCVYWSLNAFAHLLVIFYERYFRGGDWRSNRNSQSGIPRPCCF